MDRVAEWDVPFQYREQFPLWGELAAGADVQNDLLFGCWVVIYPWTKGGDRLRTDLAIMMFVRFSVDVLLLTGTSMFLGDRPNILRSAASASVGGSYSGACFLWPWLGALPFRALSMAAVVLLAFGPKRSAVGRVGVYVLLTLALEGAVNSTLGSGRRATVLYATLICLLCALTRRKSLAMRKIHITHLGRCVKLDAFLDTGNMLKDPVSGKGVVVIGPDAAKDLTGLTVEELSDPVKTLERSGIPGLRLIPYSSVGNRKGLMLAMCFRDSYIDGSRKDILAAFAPEGIGGHDALIGGAWDV